MIASLGIIHLHFESRGVYHECMEQGHFESLYHAVAREQEIEKIIGYIKEVS